MKTIYCSECAYYKNECTGSNSWYCPFDKFKRKMTEHEKHLYAIAERLHEILFTEHTTEILFQWLMSFKGVVQR